MRRRRVLFEPGEEAGPQARAAQYVRMSTEHQKYSIANQAAAIAKYAAQRQLIIVRTYEDAGRSGLGIEGREALKRLIADVQNRRADFGTILVYDVSRWGRFQDTDESAHYEFICRQAGISVQYCAEQFENDGSLTATILKGMKRAMAGEFSRELSVKVFAGQRQIVSLGFKAGGSSGYGLRRHLLDQYGNHKGELRRGDRKCLQSDRVILMPGPKHEVETVQRIYRLFVFDGLWEKQIAHLLNKEGVLTEESRAWSSGKVHRVLTSEKYIGNQLYNRVSKKLSQKMVRNPREMWVRYDGAFDAIVDRELFYAAQRIIEKRICRLTDAEMLDRLRALLRRHGTLSGPIIDAASDWPPSSAYGYRFGGLLRAFELAGHNVKRDYGYLEKGSVFRNVMEEMVQKIEQVGGTIRHDNDSGLLTINDEFTASIVIAYCYKALRKAKTARWKVHLPNSKPDITIAVRMNEENTSIQDYLLLPRIDIGDRLLWLCLNNRFEIDAYRHDSLTPLIELCARQGIGSAP